MSKSQVSKIQGIPERSITTAKDMLSPRTRIGTNQSLKISLTEAKINRTSLDQLENPDTLVVVTCGNSSVKSKIATTKSSIAKYNEELVIPIRDVRNFLEISVFEVKKGTNEAPELIGKGTRNIQYLYYGEKDENAMQLYPRVEIQFKLEPQNYGRYKDVKIEEWSEIEKSEMLKKALKMERLSDTYNAINKVTFDEDRLVICRELFDSYYLTVSDVNSLIDLFHFSYFQYLLCEVAIPRLIDLKNYPHLKSKLTFTDDQDAFEQRVFFYYLSKMKINYKP